jgi:hypothetical protein
LDLKETATWALVRRLVRIACTLTEVTNLPVTRRHLNVAVFGLALFTQDNPKEYSLAGTFSDGVVGGLNHDTIKDQIVPKQK